MSASEKLKALYEHGATFMVPREDYIPTNALPQIVAVVQLAEMYAFAKDIHAWGDGTVKEPTLPDLAHALSALEEALS